MKSINNTTYKATYFFEGPQKCPGRIRIRNEFASRIRIRSSDLRILGFHDTDICCETPNFTLNLNKA